MSNVLSEEKKQQVIALGKLGWPLRRIEQAIKPWDASAVFRRTGTFAVRAYRIRQVGVERRTPFELYSMVPTVTKIVYVDDRYVIAHQNLIESYGALVDHSLSASLRPPLAA